MQTIRFFAFRNMKFLVLLLALKSYCVCSADFIPEVPGDNSHYVEGVSRYIWMDGKDGEPVLVDLHEPVDETTLATTRNNPELNKYLLYTRENPNHPSTITFNNILSVWLSNYSGSKPLKVIIHGWNNNGNSDVNNVVRQAFLDEGDVNVIVVDWSHLAGNWNYATVVAGVPAIGTHIGNFIQWLISSGGGSWANTHIVGHSLGAHTAGCAGRATNNRPARITGLDPAGPLWASNNNVLKPSDATYVEGIHTDGGSLGIFNNIGTADFYPNGGRHAQPGCGNSSCSHGRAYEFFASTVRNKHLFGQQCNNLSEAQNGNCNGSFLQMGTANIPKIGNGIYGLTTGSSYPY